MARRTTLPLPATAHVPGRGRPDFTPPPDLAPDAALAFGADLYDAGCLWEAHEVWEGLWQGLPREAPAARLLRGWIQVAAAGLKRAAGREAGVVSLVAKARAERLAAGDELVVHGWRTRPASLAAALAAWQRGGVSAPPELDLEPA